MDARLEAIYRLIPPGKGVIDVGTDHAYLPVRLALDGYTGRILASDLREGPLAAARRTAAQAGVSARIGFILADGLAGCDPDAVDTIVIAGMGGDLICRILDRAEWCLDGAYVLILQPMTKAEVLRYWLVNNGFCLAEEKLVRDGTILYQVIRAQYSQNMKLSDAELFAGAYENICAEPLCGEWLDSLILRFEKEERGLLSSLKPEEGRLSICRSVKDGLLEMKGKIG